jgi:hypothetical protein
MLFKDLPKLAPVLTIAMSLAACSENSGNSSSSHMRLRSEPPRGFFDRVADHLTDRECNVVRFTCPFGLGPAGEPCECVDPRGIVLQGRTVK